MVSVLQSAPPFFWSYSTGLRSTNQLVDPTWYRHCNLHPFSSGHRSQGLDLPTNYLTLDGIGIAICTPFLRIIEHRVQIYQPISQPWMGSDLPTNQSTLDGIGIVICTPFLRVIEHRVQIYQPISQPWMSTGFRSTNQSVNPGWYRHCNLHPLPSGYRAQGSDLPTNQSTLDGIGIVICTPFLRVIEHRVQIYQPISQPWMVSLLQSAPPFFWSYRTGLRSTNQLVNPGWYRCCNLHPLSFGRTAQGFDLPTNQSTLDGIGIAICTPFLRVIEHRSTLDGNRRCNLHICFRSYSIELGSTNQSVNLDGIALPVVQNKPLCGDEAPRWPEVSALTANSCLVAGRRTLLRAIELVWLHSGLTEIYETSTLTPIAQCSGYNAWLLLGWVTAERSCPCKQPVCPAIGGGSEVTFKPLVPRLSVREGFLALTSP
ncbi:hypothetical protein J6590_006294 [Homalodisca vitripennis]|nr:hypothetical protein J6590_006294 [Homalodisca vitripennis]